MSLGSLSTSTDNQTRKDAANSRCPVVMRLRRGIAITVICSVAVTANAADDESVSVLHLVNGDFVAGRLLASDDAETLVWQADAFVQPFRFPLANINSIHCSQVEKPPRPQGDYCFELKDNNIVHGNLLNVTGEAIAVDAFRYGRIQLRREYIRRFHQTRSTQLIYSGPNGLSGWDDRSSANEWHDQGGHPATGKAGATLVGDFGIPAQATIEFDLSWKTQPRFLLALAVDDTLPSVDRAFHVEVWDDESGADADIVVCGESERDADVVAVEKIAKSSGHVHLRLYLDQLQQRLLVYSPNGQPLGELRLHSTKPHVRAGLRLTNKRGDVTLERLQITRWNGEPPQTTAIAKSWMHAADGSIIYGDPVAYDASSGTLTIRDGKTERPIAADSIIDLFFATPVAPEAGSSDAAAEQTVCVTCRDGTRFSGSSMQVDKSHLLLNSAGVIQPIQLPLSCIRSLSILKHGRPPTTTNGEGRAGHLEMDSVLLRGRLATDPRQPDETPITWRPDMSVNAATLRHGRSGRIVYRNTVSAEPAQSVAQARPLQPKGGFGDVFKKLMRKKTLPIHAIATTTATMYLRSGDTIPCTVNTLDEKGVYFTTPLSDATFIPHKRLKAVQLTDRTGVPSLDEVRRDRLLTLPRLQKDTPPTHLIYSTTGDFLRGRVLAMNENVLTAEVRLDTIQIPRSRVSQVIWLHEDELSGDGVVAPTTIPGATRVQTLHRGGKRLTFVATHWDGRILSGNSDLLGACRVDLSDADQLLLNDSIEQAAARLAYQQWKLHYATEPAYLLAKDGDDPGTRQSGIESPLVGQDAPDFKLNLLDGLDFRLSDSRGRIVVLDFWATWCGPCVQNMPRVAEVVSDFTGGGVDLIAVNLEEQPPRITAMLERHQLNLRVALDRDGVVASRYAVTAIPQTVVIDRDGKIARLFVGGGSDVTEQLRSALEELTEKSGPAASE